MKRQHTNWSFLCLGLTVLLVISACSKKEIVYSGDGPAGIYALVSVNGDDVPASVSHDGVSLRVNSGDFTINDDGTCRSKTVFVVPSGSETSREVKATYTRDGSKLTMQWEGAGITTGTIQGDTFTMDNEGMVPRGHVEL